MSNLPILEGPTLPPVDGQPPRKLVILVHGVGADGNDLIGLAPYFQEALPDAMFIAPNAPYDFDMGPMGYQWFSIQDFGPETRLLGTQSSAPVLDAFIDEKLAEYGLEENNLALLGFSQGTTMSLYVGLRRSRPLAGILGYSGLLVDGALLPQEIKSRPPVMLIHGDDDPVIPAQALPEAVEGLKGAGIEVESHLRPNLGHGIDDEGLRLGVRFLGSKLIQIIFFGVFIFSSY